jgi:hypothetical protein
VGGFAGRAARQHADLITTSSRIEAADLSFSGPVLRGVVLTLLAVDGVISAVVGALLLPSSIGPVPFPVSAVVTGLVNAALVWAALHWTTPRLAALPLWTWLVTVAAMTFGGPGGDVIFGGRGIMGYSALLFIVVGALPSAWLLWRRNRRAP